jgi:hypothetical protein
MNIEWHESLMKKVNERNINLAILGKILIAFSIGAIFSIKLVKYGYYILIASTLIIASYLKNSFTSQLKDEKLKYSTNVIDFTAGLLLLLFLGVQSPHIPFKIYFLIIGFVLLIPAVIEMFGGKK